jgi:hypothetical protein
MDQLITPADAEQAVIDELDGLYVVGTGIPDPKPDLFVRVLTTGGDQRDLVTDTPWLTLEVFALRESEAFRASADIVARLQLAVRHGRLGGEVAYAMAVSGLPQNYPLPSVPSHRRYVTTIAPDIRRRVTSL